MFKKMFHSLVVLSLLLFFVSGFSSSSASAATTPTKATFTSNYGTGYSKNFWVQKKHGGINRLTAYYNVNQYGVQITSASPKTEKYLFPYSVTTSKPQIVVPKTNGMSQTAQVYCDYKQYIFKAWKFGSVYESTERLTLTIKVTKIDKVKKTVTYTVSGFAN